MPKISIIEDDQLIAQMYRIKLESDGFDVDIAENGMDGIQMVKERVPDLILLDYSLPDIDGDTVLRELRKTDTAKNTPVIVLTNMDSTKIADEMKQWGISEYLVKASLTPRQVVEKIKQALSL